ncbi:hypothetical protein BHE74_00012782 [Ensete ventricosum]|nr:hypothetical protein BHE74_00012782 [Ensete ventricosum]
MGGKIVAAMTLAKAKAHHEQVSSWDNPSPSAFAQKHYEVAPRVGSHVTQGDSPPPKTLFNSGVKGKPKSASKASTEMHTPGASELYGRCPRCETCNPYSIGMLYRSLMAASDPSVSTVSRIRGRQFSFPRQVLEHLCSTDPITELAHLIGPTSKFPCSVGSIPEHLCSSSPVTELARSISPTYEFPYSIGSVPEHLCSANPITELARSISPTYEFPYSIGSVPEHLCSANPIIELARSISSTSEFPCSAGPVPEHLCSASPVTELARLISLTSEFPCSAGSVPEHLCLASPVTKLARSISPIFEFPCSAGSVPEHLCSVSLVTKLACSISPIFEFPCLVGSVLEHLCSFPSTYAEPIQFSSHLPWPVQFPISPTQSTKLQNSLPRLIQFPRQDELDSIVNPLPNARPHHQRPNRVPRERLPRGEGNDIANISLAVTSPPPWTTRSLAWPT